MCERRDLNPHTLRHQNLNLACLPIPPRSQVLTTGWSLSNTLQLCQTLFCRMGELRDLNPRPPEPQSGALPTELNPPFSAPGGSRTPDLLLRRQLLYPAELLALPKGVGMIGFEPTTLCSQSRCATPALHPGQIHEAGCITGVKS